MEKYFNIAGPCNPAQHYMVPALERLPEVSRLVSRGQTFVVHAARQSGNPMYAEIILRYLSNDEQVFVRDETVGGKTIHVIGL